MTFPSVRTLFAARSIVLPGLLLMIWPSASFAQWPVSYLVIPSNFPYSFTTALPGVFQRKG